MSGLGACARTLAAIHLPRPTSTRLLDLGVTVNEFDPPTPPKVNVSANANPATKAEGSPQFFNEAGYSISRAAGAPSRYGSPGRKRYSAREILSEAARVPGHCAHVAQPSPPRTLFGLDANQLLSWWDSELEPKASSILVPTTKLGRRRQRSDTPVLLVAVASYPGSPDHTNAGYVAWRDAVVRWAMDRYGLHLRSILEHVDESYGHLHIVIDNQGRSVKPLMAGHRAAMEVKQQCHSRAEQGAAYQAGCRQLQEEFWQAVGRPCDLARMSASPRPRRSRAAHLAAKEVTLRERESELDRQRRALVESDAAQQHRKWADDAEFRRREEMIELRDADLSTKIAAAEGRFTRKLDEIKAREAHVADAEQRAEELLLALDDTEREQLLARHRIKGGGR
jgi:hypothetical protein